MMLECLCKCLFTFCHYNAKCSRDGGVLLGVILASAILEIICASSRTMRQFYLQTFFSLLLFQCWVGFVLFVWGLVFDFFGGVFWCFCCFVCWFFFQDCEDCTFLNFAKVCFLSPFFLPCPSLQVYTHTFNSWKQQACMYSPHISSYCQVIPFVFMAWSYLQFPSLFSPSFLSIGIC